MVDPLDVANPLWFAKLATGLAKLLMELRAERERPYKRAGRYFMSLGDTLQQMTVKLRQEEIPRVEGHRFNSRVGDFDEYTSSLRGRASVLKARADVRKAAYVARRIDWHYINYDEHVARAAGQWLAEMERTAGLLQALGQRLSEGA